ncbi:MAG: hypothetical protein AVDCRST_MAG64-3622, partial [uncultured Phycisphaerae bacterium]
VRHLDVADHEVVLVAGLELRDRLLAGGGHRHHRVELAEHVADRRADVRRVVGDEDARAGDHRVLVDLLQLLGPEDRVRPAGGLAERGADRLDVVEDLLQLLPQIVVADVLVDERVGVGRDVVQRAGGLGADLVGDLVARVDALDEHQVEHVQRDRDV